MSLLLATSGDIASSEVSAEGVDFDGTYDYLSRSTDLVGNVDSKTFTFSAWVYIGSITKPFSITTFYTTTNTFQVLFDLGVNKNLQIVGRNSAGTIILYATAPISTPSWNTFHNILISIDLANSANRSIYIDDIIVSTTWETYTNDLIDLTTADKFIGKDSTTSYAKGRLSHVFLSYDYIDLSIEANRRLFITADGKPTPTATLKALNPILYLPMKDAATCHINEGTGGNFTLNGTIATSERGANQDNCVASYFDGSADYLSRTSLTGVADGKQFVLSFNINQKTLGTQVFTFSTNTTQKFYCTVANSITLLGYNTSGTQILYIQGSPIEPLAIGKNSHIVISADLSDINKRNVFVDGKIVAVNWTKYINDNINFSISTTPRYYIGASPTPNNYFNGNIGELYFDTKYIDLATNNPFWDAVENKPVPVRKVIANTGVTPLIAMPLDASNAGKNYGTGGDFTANSAPYVGARGASEWWQRTAKFDGSTSYLSSSGLTGIADSKYLTIVANVYKTASTLYYLVGASNSNIQININSSNQLNILAKNSAGSFILNATVTTTIANTTWTEILVSIDLSNSANRSIYLNGIAASVTWTTYANDTIDFTNALWVVGADAVFGNKYNGSMSLWMDNTYIDFTRETNRLKYIDGLGYPTNLNDKVTSGIITKPALYLNFNDPSNLGKNDGYGGNMTVNGTLVSGSDVLG